MIAAAQDIDLQVVADALEPQLRVGDAGREINLAIGGGDANTQLWLERVGNDLQVDILGSSDHLTISGWYGSNARAQVQSIKTADGLTLDGQLAQLVSAMASYSAGNPGFNPTQTSQMPNDPTLQNAVAAAWH
jgi:hypothetical protein